MSWKTMINNTSLPYYSFLRLLVGSKVWVAALLISGFTIQLVMIWLLFPMTVDDAYISFHYANNLAQGHGLVWFASADPVEGYTNFLWVILLSIFIRIGFDVIWVAKILGIIFSLCSIFILYRITILLNKSGFGVMPAILFASTPALSLWAISGMETVLFIFLMLFAAHRFFVEEENKLNNNSRYWSSLLFMLLGLTRPEGVILFATLVFLRLAFWIRKGVPRKSIFVYITWLIIIGIICFIYFIWRWQYFGYPLPNTYYVKAQSSLLGILGHIGVYIIPYGLRVFPFVILVLFYIGNSKHVQLIEKYLIVMILVIGLINLGSSDWMAAHRLLLPMTPLILLLAHERLDYFFSNVLENSSTRQRFANALILLSLVLYAISPLMYTTNMYHRVMATQMDMSVYRWAVEMQSIVDGQYVAVGKWLANNMNGDCKVVAGNVGAIAYYSQCYVIDQIGLTDEYIARHGWRVDYLLGQDPEFIVIESDTPIKFGGLYGTRGERWENNELFAERYELLFVLHNDRYHESALFIHHLPHATWLYARKDLGFSASDSTGVDYVRPDTWKDG